MEGQESLTLYQYAHNNPVLKSDPEGDIPIIPMLGGAALGAVVEIGTQVTVNAFLNKPLTDIDWADVGFAAGSGFITAGLSTTTKLSTSAIRIATASISTAGEVAKASTDFKTEEHGGTKTVFNGKKAVGEAAIDLAAGKGGGLIGRGTGQVVQAITNSKSIKATGELIKQYEKK